ncbi:response regulator [Caballeronia sp. NK8]|uniref:response regulator n=1 Tax=Caballeronia sp. NK8 TaxID=140098 RepID=UPI001BB6F1A9|nr:response regulator [Caballeronia sp. NK8]BCQ22351.1 response regulator [Caballeronia sp. NK8]
MNRPILVAEDNPSDLELLHLALERCNTRQPIVSVDDGQEALDYLNHRGQFSSRPAGHPDFVLLDIKMPRVTGLEVLAAMRAAPEFRHIPVIALTSSREELDIVRAYELGINGYIVKAADFGEFRRDVASIRSMWGHLNEAPPRFRPHAAHSTPI